jgi:hypothetical protein
LAGCFLSGFFVWLVVSPSFCLNQDLQDIRDFQDGRLMCSGRFSGSGFFGWLVVWLVVFCLAFLFGLLFHLLFV